MIQLKSYKSILQSLKSYSFSDYLLKYIKVIYGLATIQADSLPSKPPEKPTEKTGYTKCGRF